MRRIPCAVRCILAIILLALCGHGSSAQAPERYIFSVRHYGTADGLPQRNINAIAQDPRGFIWLATPMGLVRFDGYTFVNHTRANGLTMDAVKTVVCDGDGLLWIWHPDGSVDIFDPLTDRCNTLQQHFAVRSPAPTNEPVLGINAGDDGTVAFYQSGHLLRYRSAREGLVRIPLTCDGTPDPYRVEANGDVWCWCNGRENSLVGDLMRVRSSGTGTITRIPDVKRVANMGHDLWAGKPSGERGLYLLLSTGRRWVFPDGTVTDLNAVRDTTTAVQQWKSIMQMELTDDLWLVNTTIRRMHAGDDPLTGPVLFDFASVLPEARYFMNDVLRDRAGNVWACGAFGLFKLTMAPDVFQRWLWDSTLVTGVGRNIRGLALVNDQLHVNTEYTGYWTLDARSGAVLSRKIGTGYGLSVIPDGQGGTWRSNDRDLIHEPFTGTAEHFTFTREHQGAWSLLVLGPHRVLMGSYRGLLLTDGNGKAEPILHPDQPELDRTAVWFLKRDRSGRILCCTETGLYALSDDGSVEDHWGIHVPTVSGIPHALPTDDIRHFYEDSTGMFWLATATQGLLRWDRRTGHTQVIGVREGLPATSIHAVYPDAYGSLWLPTDNGLVCYEPSTGQVKVFTAADGITNNEFNRIAYTQGPDGRLYFGGFNGITVVDPASLRAVTGSPASNLVLEAVWQQEGDSAELTDRTLAVLGGAPITLRPDDRFFTVDMALLSYDDPTQVRYAWRIEGIDQQWNRQVQPHLRFTALPYGEHTLHIIAIDANGRSSTNELVLPIIVLRPIYLRWWFIALCVLVLGGLVYALVQYRLRQLQRVILVRDRIAMDLHDEVGSDLSGIVLFSTAVKNNAGDLPLKETNMLDRIADNSTHAMESMNDIVWSVNSANDQISHLLDRMHAYAEPLCEATGIELHFDVAEGITARKLGMVERKSLYLIFKEAVNNAVKHAQCSHITVTLRMHRERIELIVSDNGIGLRASAEAEGTLGGNGLGNMQRRAKDAGGTLEVRARKEGGTEVVLHITNTKT